MKNLLLLKNANRKTHLTKKQLSGIYILLKLFSFLNSANFKTALEVIVLVV